METFVNQFIGSQGGRRLKLEPITSISDLLLHDSPYPRFRPVILSGHSLWRKFVDSLKAVKIS